MKIDRRTASRMLLRWTLGCLVFACPFASLSAQPAQPAPAPSTQTAGPPASTAPPPDFRTVLTLNGPWRFQIGDDLEWAETNFDDSKWQPVTLSDSLASQGFDSYSGYAWYRLRLEPEQLSALTNSGSGGALALLV